MEYSSVLGSTPKLSHLRAHASAITANDWILLQLPKENSKLGQRLWEGAQIEILERRIFLKK